MADDLLRLVRQILLFTAVLTALELLRPARPGQPVLRRGLVRDLGFAALGPVLVGPVTVVGLDGLTWLRDTWMPSHVADLLAVQPWILQFAEVLILGEIIGYWVHRACHTSPLLWRFHAVHHSSDTLDWMSAHRQHPAESALLLWAANLVPITIGFPTETVLAFVLFQKFHTAALHANLSLPRGRWEGWFAGPRFHHWHHAREGGVTNYASLFPWIDRVFGTFGLPEGEPEAFGLGRW